MNLKTCLAALCPALLSACATYQHPEYAGQIAKADERVGVVYEVIAPGADTCTADHSPPVNLNGDDRFQFLFPSEGSNNRDAIEIACAYDSETSKRLVQPVFNQSAFRTSRATNTVVNGILTGGIGLLVSPIAAEMTRGQYYVVPPLVHVSPPDDSLTIETASANWDDFKGRATDQNTDTKVHGFFVKEEFLNELRQEDLRHVKKNVPSSAGM